MPAPGLRRLREPPTPFGRRRRWRADVASRDAAPPLSRPCTDLAGGGNRRRRLVERAHPQTRAPELQIRPRRSSTRVSCTPGSSTFDCALIAMNWTWASKAMDSLRLTLPDADDAQPCTAGRYPQSRSRPANGADASAPTKRLRRGDRRADTGGDRDADGGSDGTGDSSPSHRSPSPRGGAFRSNSTPLSAATSSSTTSPRTASP